MIIKKILFFTLTNIGDVILTLPALDALIARFSQAEITVISGPRAAGLFKGNPAIRHYIAYDKRAPLAGRVAFFLKMRKRRFDMVIDLRNSLFGLLLGRQRRLIVSRVAEPHACAHHLGRVAAILGGELLPAPRVSLRPGDQDRRHIDSLLKQNRLAGKKIALISPGARSEIKRWSKDKFCEAAKALTADGMAVLLIGDESEKEITAYISRNAPGSVDCAGLTTLPQLAYLLSLSALLITNDSANLHLAGYLDVPTVAVFGPTDDRRYGPWSDSSMVIKASLSCRPCKQAQCRKSTLDCLHSIEAAEVIAAARKLALGPEKS